MFDDAGTVTESLVYQGFYVLEFEWDLVTKVVLLFRETGQRVFGTNA